MRGIEQIPFVYDAMMWLFEAFGLARWRRRLVEGAQGRVLEVGCGTGRNLPLYRAPASVVALEPSDEALRRAVRRAPHVTFVRASVEALPFRDGAFDTVVSGLVFCSVDDPARGLSEVRRVLVPTGELRMLEHVRAAGWRGRWQDWVQPVWTKVAGGCRPNRQTERTVEAQGFVIDQATRRARGAMRRFVALKP